MQILGTSVQPSTERPLPARTTRNERIVFALGEETRAQLLPHFDPTSLPPAEYHWIDLSALDKAAWEKAFVDLEPTILVTGWGTPTLPDHSTRLAENRLRYVCHIAGSVRQIVPRRLIEQGVMVSNWGTTVSSDVAEHAMLLTLATLRNLPAWNAYMDAWPQRPAQALYIPLETRSLRGKRVGLHGFGSIARGLVQLLSPFGVDLAAYSWGVPPDLFEQHGVQRCDSLEELFSRSQVLIECEALTPQSRGTVNAAILSCLPDDAVFVNVGRGWVVDEDALAEVAITKNLRLGLDVYRQEPLPSESPLRAVSSALLSPHIAGPARDGFAGLCQFALANLQRYLLGEKIEAQVSLDVYDRST